MTKDGLTILWIVKNQENKYLKWIMDYLLIILNHTELFD